MLREKSEMKIKRFFTLPVITAIAIFPALIFHSGCNLIFGGVAALGTPTSSEMKVTAEYDLAAQKGKKIVVLVDQPLYLKNQVNMRFMLTDTINKMIQEGMKIPADQLISYDAVADFRANTPDYTSLSADKIGAALGADFVLLVVIDDCKIYNVSQSEFLNGEMTLHAELVNVADGAKLWPVQETARIIKIGFESEHRGKDVSQLRLAVAAAHCITRYLYDSPKNKFKVTDEITDVGWGK
jgi:hypothetical protein